MTSQTIIVEEIVSGINITQRREARKDIERKVLHLLSALRETKICWPP